MAETMSDIRLIVVEDNDDHYFLLGRQLKRVYPTAVMIRFSSGEEALEWLHQQVEGGGQQLPDLAIVDLKLPGLHGFDLLREMKRDDHLRDIPVLILTTSEVDDDRHHALHLQAAGYLVKPVTAAELSSTFEPILALS